MTDPSRPWSPVDEATWTVGVGALRVEAEAGAWWLRGPCPGCGHPLSRNVSHQLGAAFVGEAGSRTLVLRCNCGQPHTGRPASELPAGCGALGGVELTP